MSTSVIIIGAPRSGTNMLRDLLASMPGIATWPCDEINYIWRHGNIRHSSDEFTPDMARTEIRDYIRKQFNWVSRKYNARIVVEKTCANSLRIPFVDRAVPGAKYLFIRRDGLDVVGSALLRWKAPLDIPYLAKKARFVPVTDFPYYATRYIWNRVYRLFSAEERLAFWGPQLNGMDQIVRNHRLDEVCAIQWKRCVDSASDAFALMPKEQWLEIGYEDFVRDPVTEMERVMSHIGEEASVECLRQCVKNVRASSVGKGRAVLDEETVRRLSAIIGDTQARYGYL